MSFILFLILSYLVLMLDAQSSILDAQSTPCAIMALATFINPAILAPLT